MPTINATLINLYHVCHRELWLHAHGIRMEHNSEVVYEGKLLGETTYDDRADKNTQLELLLPDGLGMVKIDFYDAKTKTVHETKKSEKMERAHEAQVKFYLWALWRNGVEGATGLIEYPKTRQRTAVTFDPATEVTKVEGWIADILALLEREQCPPVLNKPVCRTCSYCDFCYATEG